MDPWARIDLYCERTDWSFWSEPLNALTNLAFVVAAICIVRRVRRERGVVLWDAAVLAALAVLVGVGSFLFHTFATVWSRWLDLLFIAVFIYLLIARFLARVAGLHWPGVLVGLVLYFGLERAARAAFPPETLSGSVLYFPPLLAMAVFAVYAWQRADRAALPLATAAVAFVGALALRTIDQAVCPAWPVGTHFLWHLLVAWVLYLAATAVLAPGRSPAPATQTG